MDLIYGESKRHVDIQRCSCRRMPNKQRIYSAAKTLKWLIRWQPGFLMTASESNHPEGINTLKGTVIKNIYI